MSLEFENDYSSDELSNENSQQIRKCKISYTRAFLLLSRKLDASKTIPNGIDPVILREIGTASDIILDKERTSGGFPSHNIRCNEKCKISYTRDFLLSLSKLEVCKTLPNGFDQTILGEFGSTSHVIQDRQRTLGGLPSRGFRCNEYVSLPTRREFDSFRFARGTGLWESRSPGQSDKDSDSQSERDSDMGAPSHWTTRCSKHDGLLGSGSFRRPSDHGASKLRDKEYQHLKRSSDPYYPPCSHKPSFSQSVAYTRRGGNDSYNDETFGSFERTSEKRAEEERRRESFELMRKEQHKSLQEKHEFDHHQHKEQSDSKYCIPGDNSNTLLDPSKKTSLISQSPPSRPLVPPGFTSATVERNSQAMSEKSLLQNELTMEESMNEKEDGQSESIMEKLFGGAFSIHTSISDCSAEGDSDLFVDNGAEASKFAHWFVEEEKKVADACNAGNSNGLFSLISGAEKSSIPSVLTCEDLEQSMLSDISSGLGGQNHLDEKMYPKCDVDDNASQHILSLLQKGSQRPEVEEEAPHDLGRTLTLETLFGSDFMKELRDPVGSARIDATTPHRVLGHDAGSSVPGVISNVAEDPYGQFGQGDGHRGWHEFARDRLYEHMLSPGYGSGSDGLIQMGLRPSRNFPGPYVTRDGLHGRELDSTFMYR